MAETLEAKVGNFGKSATADANNKEKKERKEKREKKDSCIFCTKLVYSYNMII